MLKRSPTCSLFPFESLVLTLFGSQRSGESTTCILTALLTYFAFQFLDDFVYIAFLSVTYYGTDVTYIPSDKEKL